MCLYVKKHTSVHALFVDRNAKGSLIVTNGLCWKIQRKKEREGERGREREREKREREKGVLKPADTDFSGDA